VDGKGSAPAPPLPGGKSAAARSAARDRRERRRRETRARLLEAAIRLIGARGLEAATVSEIAEAADVGFGTFYSYFPSRDELLLEAVRGVLGRVAERNDEAAAASSDPARAFAIGLRRTLTLAERDPATASFALSLASAGHRDLWRGLALRMEGDVKRGIESGRFRVHDAPTLIEMVGGAVLAVMRARLEGRLGSESGPALAAHLLRLLGVDAEEARGIASEPLPRLAGEAGR
jgi:AcrR family transcriptional regulator